MKTFLSHPAVGIFALWAIFFAVITGLTAHHNAQLWEQTERHNAQMWKQTERHNAQLAALADRFEARLAAQAADCRQERNRMTENTTL